MKVVVAKRGRIQTSELAFNSSSVFILGTNNTCEVLPIRGGKRQKRSGENEWSCPKSRIWLNIRTIFNPYLFSFGAPIKTMKSCR